MRRYTGGVPSPSNFLLSGVFVVVAGAIVLAKGGHLGWGLGLVALGLLELFLAYVRWRGVRSR